MEFVHAQSVQEIPKEPKTASTRLWCCVLRSNQICLDGDYDGLYNFSHFWEKFGVVQNLCFNVIVEEDSTQVRPQRHMSHTPAMAARYYKAVFVALWKSRSITMDIPICYLPCHKALSTLIGCLSEPLWLGFICQLYLDHNLIGVKGASCSDYFKHVEYLISSWSYNYASIVETKPSDSSV